MIQSRWWAVGTAALTLLISACSAPSAAGPTSSSSSSSTIEQLPSSNPAVTVITDPATTSTTSTTLPPTTTTTVPALKVPLDHTVKKGEHSDAVAYIQDRLIKIGFDPGALDGTYGTSVQDAVWAFQELLGLNGKDVTGEVTPELWDKMQDPLTVKPRDPTTAAIRHVEIYLPEQVLILWNPDGTPRLITHISTGSGHDWCEKGWCGKAITPSGVYGVKRFHKGWEQAPLGLLYNAVYFNGGIAMHGALSVPNYPASHGCIRMPVHVAEYFHTLVETGDPVLVYDGQQDPRTQGSPQPPVNVTDPNATTTTTTATTVPGATTLVPTTIAPTTTTTAPHAP
jgi:hypothetical protein